MADLVSQAIQLDATDEGAPRRGRARLDVAVISIGENIESSLLVVMQVKDLGVETIIAKAVTPLHGRILERLGVTRVIYPERDMAIRVAHGLVVPNVTDYIELSKDFSIVELPAPKDWVGQDAQGAGARPRFGLTLIAIKRQSATGRRGDHERRPRADDWSSPAICWRCWATTIAWRSSISCSPPSSAPRPPPPPSSLSPRAAATAVLGVPVHSETSPSEPP